MIPHHYDHDKKKKSGGKNKRRYSLASNLASIRDNKQSQPIMIFAFDSYTFTACSLFCSADYFSPEDLVALYQSACTQIGGVLISFDGQQ